MKGYRIGWQCFGSQEAALDYQMSQVIPAITADGKLQHPVKQGKTWFYAGQEVKPSFGECDPEQDYADGVQIGGAIMLLMASAYGIRFVVQFVQSMFYRNEESEQV